MERSSRQELFYKKRVRKKFQNSQKNTRVGSLFLNKVAGLRAAYLFKKRLQHKCFPVKYVKFVRTYFFTEHLRSLLLKLIVAVNF